MTAVTENPGHPESESVRCVDSLVLGGVTRTPVHVGQEVAFPLGMSVVVICDTAVAPGARVTKAGAGVGVLVAWAAWAPVESMPAAPGYPKSVQETDPVFLNRSGVTMCPAAPLPIPADTDKLTARHGRPAVMPDVVVDAALVVVTALAVVVVTLAVVVVVPDDEVLELHAAAPRATMARVTGIRRERMSFS